MTCLPRVQVTVRGGAGRRGAGGRGRRDAGGAGAAAAPALPARRAGDAAGGPRGLLRGEYRRRRRPAAAPWPSVTLVPPQPLQVRESFPAQATALRALGALGARAALLRDAAALEAARVLARDLGGADPERMTPAAFAAFVQAHFAESPVRVRVIDDGAAIARDYPLFAAVSRAADAVPRHRGERRGRLSTFLIPHLYL